MSNFVGRPPLLKFAMGCHRNHLISHSPNQNFLEDTFVSHPGDNLAPMKNCPGGGVQGNLIGCRGTEDREAKSKLDWR